MKPVPLTELEAAALGEVFIQQPCTAYGVRRAFARSPTPTWSGSAGTIYPVLERLERRRLVRSRPIRQGLRRSRLLSLTARGVARLRTWVMEPLTPAITGPPMDLLRVRVGFLGAVPAASRAVFLRRAAALLTRELAAAERYRGLAVAAGRSWGVRTADGVVSTQQARLAWLRKVARDAGRSPKRPQRA